MMTGFIFGEFTPPEILVQLGPIHIYTYGLIVALAAIAGYLITVRMATLYTRVLGKDYVYVIDTILLPLFIIGAVCARALFVLYNLDYFSAHAWEILALWHGGWVWQGGLIGATIALFLYARTKKLPFWLLADIMTPGVVLAQAVGRWGNYFNQEAYGLPTRLLWGIPIKAARRVTGYEGFSHFHPVFLYESLWDLAVFLLLYLASRRVMLHFAKDRKHEGGWVRFGTIFLGYAVLYSLGRFFLEFIRIDIVPVVWGLRAPQWISIGIIGVAGYFLASRHLHKSKRAGIVST